MKNLKLSGQFLTSTISKLRGHIKWLNSKNIIGDVIRSDNRSYGWRGTNVKWVKRWIGNDMNNWKKIETVFHERIKNTLIVVVVYLRTSTY